MQVNSTNETQVTTASNVTPDNYTRIDISLNFKNIFLEQCRSDDPSQDTKNHLTSNTKKIGSRVNLLTIGKISPENPTISDLLVKDPEYGQKCWQIIHSEQNRGKPFNHIQSGTNIYINPQTLEISWKNNYIDNEISMEHYRHSNANDIDTQSALKIHSKSKKNTGMQFLGRISDENLTVSSLLVKHPDYNHKCWQIVHSTENNNKPFNKLRPGTAIYINSKTLELSWKTDKGPQKQNVSQLTPTPYMSINDDKSPGNHLLSDKLESAVRSYLGRSYDDLDCYGLVIRGLKHLGIEYSGKNGLKEKLVQKALTNGLPINSYLTGEGITNTTGYNVFSKTLQNISNPKISAQNLLKEMKPFLDNGLILSFSTPTRGHTGVISNKNKLWTYINSGTLDNQFNKQRISKGVGEERLVPEIYNWFRLAANRKEPLQITLGRVSQERLIAENLISSKGIG